MLTVLVTLVEIGAVVLAFWKLGVAWVIVIAIAGFLAAVLVAIKRRRFGPVFELSPEANLLLQKFGHYYSMPRAGQDFSSAASGTGFALVILSLITAYKFSWWYLALAMALFGLMGLVSRGFNPSNFLVDDKERAAHNEIVEYLNSKQDSA